MAVEYKIGEKGQRPWGNWEVIDVGEEYIVKRIIVCPKQKLSLQLHHHRSEHWIIAKGNPLITLDETTKEYQQNDHVFIPVEVKHRIENPTDTDVIFIEVQAGKTLDENDIVRFDDIYGRN